MPAMLLVAPGPPPPAEPPWDIVIVVCAILLLFWAVVLRPQSRAAARRRAWLDALQAGAEVRLQTGVQGRVVSVSDDRAELVLDLGDGVTIPVRSDWLVGPTTT